VAHYAGLVSFPARVMQLLYQIKVVLYSMQACGSELIPVSWQSACRWHSHKPTGRLSLLSASYLPRCTASLPVVSRL